jgi:RNA polymerase-binding transcription factor DksA
MVIQYLPGADGDTHAVEHPVRFGRDRIVLDPPRLEQFRNALDEQRRFRLEQLRQLDAAEPATADQLVEVTAALRSAAETALTEIDAALNRLRNGSYGRCQHCQREILPERLEILPAAALCMPCQHARELPTD